MFRPQCVSIFAAFSLGLISLGRFPTRLRGFHDAGSYTMALLEPWQRTLGNPLLPTGAGVGPGTARGAKVAPWTRIAHCNGRASKNRLDFEPEMIRVLAKSASQVKICTAGKPEDCVVSAPDSFPVHMLRQGWAISHTPCDRGCVSSTWIGDRANHLWTLCAPPYAGKLQTTNMLYHACHNHWGLHLHLADGHACTWNGTGDDSLEVFINNDPTSLGVLSRNADCSPSGPWLGPMSVAKCASDCSRWGRFVHVTNGNYSCKCARSNCTPTSDNTSTMSVYRPKGNAAALSKMDGVIAMIRGPAVPVRFNRCALVGSSSDFFNKSYGAEIDGHDTVIRVNRIPTGKYYKDFGSRTDVLFTGHVAEGRRTYTKTGQWYRLFGGKLKWCPFEATNCPFRMLVLKGSDAPEYRRTWEQRYRWRPTRSAFPLGHQSEKVNILTYQMLRAMAQRKRPTNGLHAFVTFSLLCKSMTAYGFSGGKSADGHRISHRHSLGLEHELMRRIVDGDFNENETRRFDMHLMQRWDNLVGKHRIVQPPTPVPGPTAVQADGISGPDPDVALQTADASEQTGPDVPVFT